MKYYPRCFLCMLLIYCTGVSAGQCRIHLHTASLPALEYGENTVTLNCSAETDAHHCILWRVAPNGELLGGRVDEPSCVHDNDGGVNSSVTFTLSVSDSNDIPIVYCLAFDSDNEACFSRAIRLDLLNPTPPTPSRDAYNPPSAVTTTVTETVTTTVTGVCPKPTSLPDIDPTAPLPQLSSSILLNASLLLVISLAVVAVLAA